MNLTKPQKLIYDMEKFAGGSIAVICGSMLTNGKREISELKRAVNEVYRLNDALRIRISEDADGVSQGITAYKEKEIEVLRFEDKAELDAYAEKYAKEPMDFYGEICEIKIVLLPEQYGVLVKLHHITGDAWTLSLIGNQLGAILNGDVPEAYSYADYVESEKEYIGSRRYEKDKAFFIEQFKKCDEVTYLSEKQSDSFAAKRKSFVIGKEETKKITDYAKAHESSAFMLFTAALSAYMNRVKMNAEKFYIGTAVLNRTTAKEKNTAGMFINTVPMLIELQNEKTFAENLAGIQDTAFSVFRHQKYNYGDVLSDLRSQFGFGEKLYDIVISYQNATIGGENDSTWYHCSMQTESLQIHIDDRDNEGIFRIHYDYLTDKFTEHNIEMFHAHLLNLLFSAIQDDGKKIYELDLLTANEKQKLLYDFNDTAMDYPKDKCVHTLFEEQVEKTPDKVAIIACDKTLTYKELNEEANRIAHALIEKGVGVGDIVAFALPRKSYLISTIFGILKSGAAYLPIDPDYPQDRIEYMLKDSKAKLFINSENYLTYFNFESDNCRSNCGSKHPCYHMYTSGSTGKPKATTIRHYNLTNFCKVNYKNKYQKMLIDSCNTVLAQTTITFDISVFEIFLSLLNGLTLVLASEEDISSPTKIASLITNYRIDVIHTTPSKISTYLENQDFQKAISRLNMLMIGAEVFNPELLRKISIYTNATIFNGYGPTETTIGVCFCQLNNNPINTLFEEQVEKTPDKVALKFGNKSFTFAELNSLANGLAKILHTKGVEHGDIVAIISNRSYHIVVAMLAIFKCGAAYLPIDYNYPKDRIDTIVTDSGCKAVLTYDVEYDSEKAVIIPEEITPILKNPTNESTPEDVCGIIYTSGSTGTPKGTLLKHKGLVNYTFANNALYGGCTCVLGFAIYTFDAFFLDTIPPMLHGVTTVMATESEQFNQLEFERLIKENPGCNFFITPAKFKQFVDNSVDKDFYKGIHNICIGGEMFPQEFIGLFDEHTNVFNVYGPTECSMWMMECPVLSEDVTLGKPMANSRVYIVDPYMNPTPIGVTGELCIAGDGVGAGYLNRPELTAEKFIDNPFGEGKLYKTGDLAYWREDGNIVYVGRNDFQVKIRGLRIELGEIENAISSVDGISQSVVIVRKNNEGRQLICAFYTGIEIEPKEIRAHIGKKLPKYMLPHIFTHLDVMPLTTSGKINRKALPEVDLYAVDTTVEYIAPQTEQEKALASAIEDVLKIEKVGTVDNFFDLGGDSLKAIELISKLEKAGYHTDTKTIFACDTVKELAEQLQKAEEQAEEDFEYPADIPATPAQMRVYTAQSMNADSTTYNVPYVFKAKEVDIEKLQKAINVLVNRHEILRTCFDNKDGTIIQVIDEKAVCKVEQLSSDDILAFIRPFDLSKAPLLRAGVYENTVMIDMHHIITDGGSMPVFLHELNELYMGRTLESIPVPYKQFAVIPQDHSESEKYWLDVFKDELPKLSINADFKRGQKQSFNGSAVYDTVDIDLHNQIQKYCKKQNITPYVFYMAAFNILLSKFSGCEDIVVGMPISGRDGKFLDTIGMFVNTIALRNKPSGAKTVEDFLQEVKENSIAAIDHQDYPFGDLVKKLGLNTADRNPLFDVMFAYQNEQMTEIVFGDARAELLPIPITTSKYDFTFNVMPRNNNVVIMAEYCTDLYEEQTIQRFIGGYKQLLTQILNGEEIKNLSAILPDEQQKLLFDFNDTAVDYPRDKCVHTLFEEQVEKAPDKVAVIACDRMLTYKDLNEESNRIAHALIEKGVGVGDIVAFALPRKSYLISTILGILKSGAAYLPIDPDYPQDRIECMLSESKARYFIDKNSIEELFSSENATNPNIVVNGKDLFCALHTSGSTGTPKMSLLKHSGIMSFIAANKRFWVGVDTVVSATIVTFDAFQMDSVLSISQGYKLVLANEDEIYNQAKFEGLFSYSDSNMFFSTPTKIDNYIDSSTNKEYLNRIKSFVIGGEVFSDALLEKVLTHAPESNVFNIYGPTETTICTVVDELEQGKDITIGKPIANTQIYIVDPYMNPTPIGVTGELCIAGDGVGAGYLNRPELSAEKFIDNPFGEGKLYKTGDLAYWREDGNIMYVGRNDFQVKIRGLRIELGEIENAISSVDGISQSVVIVRNNNEGRQLICAFYTGKEVEPKDIRAHIGKKLPKYMLPHIFTHLDVMPLTTSGKINRKALPEVDLYNIANDTEFVAPLTERQKELCTLMEKVLKTSPIGITDDFFDLGGDSLKAIEFVSKAHNEGIYFNLQNVFDYPTVSALCDCIENGDKSTASFVDIDFSAVDAILAKNTVKQMKMPEKTEVGNVLLAGATGYLGIHIFADFLDHNSGTAYCIVRGKDQADSEKRLADLMQFYFGDNYVNTYRIKVICADLQKDKFGLSEAEYTDLLSKIDTVINCAASVKHYGSYKYFYEANVETAKRLIEFSKAANARLIHTSTLSVSGNTFGDDFDGYISQEELHFYESSLYIGQPLDNVYARSKFEAEKAVLDAMADGLQANIMRMGNLTNRYSDGVFQWNYESNAFLKRVVSILEMGMVPDYLMDQYVEFTSIDEAAHAFMTIARHFSTEQTVFHINSIKVVYLDKLVEYFNKLGYDMKVVDGKTFTEALRQTAKQSGMEHIFETFINDMDENDKLQYDSNIRIENDFTVQHLKQLGFEWKDIDLAYLRRYVEYFRKIGYIK